MAEAKAFKMIPHCTKDTITYEMEELVLCKDCKHAVAQDCEQVWCSFVDDGLAHEPNWFCADGERRDAD